MPRRTRRVEPGLVIDFGRDGRPLGIEITAPGKITVASLNRVLRDLGCALVRRADLRVALAAVESKIDRRFGDLIKWSFLFWCGAVAAAALARG